MGMAKIERLINCHLENLVLFGNGTNKKDQYDFAKTTLQRIMTDMIKISSQSDDYPPKDVEPESWTSSEATEFMEKIHDMLTSEDLKSWCQLTDLNYKTRTNIHLSHVEYVYKEFLKEMGKAK